MFTHRNLTALIVLAAVACLTGAARPALADYRDIGLLLTELRNSPDKGDREKAAKELGKVGDPRAVPVLQQVAVYDLDKGVRKNARSAVLKITGEVAPRGGIAITPDPTGRLIGLMLDARKGGDRERAAKDLGGLGDPRALLALEIAAIFDRDSDVRDAARKSAVQVRNVAMTAAVAPPQPVRPAPQYLPPPPPLPQQPAPQYRTIPQPQPQYQTTPPLPTPQNQNMMPGIPGQPVGPAPQGPQADAYPQANGDEYGPPPAYSPAPIYTPPVAGPPPVVYAPPVYAYPPPVVYYYPRPAYVYPPVGLGLSFGFSFGHGRYHHR